MSNYPTKPGNWLVTTPSGERAVHVWRDPERRLTYSAGGGLVKDDGHWLMEIPSAAELAALRECARAGERYIAAHRDAETLTQHADEYAAAERSLLTALAALAKAREERT